jgi:hypothetical protein
MNCVKNGQGSVIPFKDISNIKPKQLQYEAPKIKKKND